MNNILRVVIENPKSFSEFTTILSASKILNCDEYVNNSIFFQDNLSIKTIYCFEKCSTHQSSSVFINHSLNWFVWSCRTIYNLKLFSLIYAIIFSFLCPTNVLIYTLCPYLELLYFLFSDVIGV